jgi:predicted MPP superfamily phosphohydrolase
MKHGPIRTALLATSAVTAFIVVADIVLLRLHAGGVAQAPLSALNGLAALLGLPGFLVVQVLGLRTGHHTTGGVWVVIVAVNFVLWFAGWFVLMAIVGAWRTRRAKRQGGRATATDAAPRVSRRRLITAGAAAVAAGAVGWPLLVEPRRFEVTRRTVPLRGLHPSLAGLRLVQLTDLHHGPWVPLSYIEHVVATANALRPDVVLLTGDYVHRSTAYIDPVAAALAKLAPAIGVVAVLGNHDWWEDGPRTRASLERAGIPLIDNDRRFITPDRKLASFAGDGLCIAGVGDYYEDAQRYDLALDGVPDDTPRLLLSHNPDVAEDRSFHAAGHRVDLMISGHTHGGQVYVPGLGTPIVPSRYGQKYARGLVRGPTCPVFICRGIGLTVLPVRVGIRPELAVLELQPQTASG